MARPKKPAEEPIIPPWFKVWTEWHDGIDMLTSEQAGELLKAMVRFSIDGIEPKFEDSPLKMLWSMIVNRMRLDKQKYVNQVTHNRKAGRKSAENRAEKTQKKLYQKSGVFEAENTDGATDDEQVLTSVNEEKKKEGRRKKKETFPKEPKEPIEPKEPKEEEPKEEVDENFDTDGYNMANNMWYKNNGRKTLTPAEKKYLKECIKQHGAEFICGCIDALKRDKKLVGIKTLRNAICDIKEREAERKAEEEKSKWEGLDDDSLGPKSIFGGYYE